MKILYVTGACLFKNTSANMSHNAYLKGLLENGASVDVVMADDSFGSLDKTFEKYENANYYAFSSVSFADKLRLKFRGAAVINPTNVKVAKEEGETQQISKEPISVRFKQWLRGLLKNLFYCIFPTDPLYTLEKRWVKTARRFKGTTHYDMVVSNSSPAAGHHLVELLTKNKRISYDKWIQVWEDPWYFDLYGNKGNIVKREEERLVSLADVVYYVSPLTLMYQKRLFPLSAQKMKCVPLPFFELKENTATNNQDELVFGYFGDYYSKTRNLLPFYEAIKETSHCAYIYGDSDLNLKSTEQVEVSGRVTLDILSKVQEKSNVLVHLSNLRGGQIPGKIYHYSATNKKILFILDGTDEEIEMLKEYFSRYNRYYFCNNTKESIKETIENIINDSLVVSERIDEFSPKVVGRMLIDGHTTA